MNISENTRLNFFNIGKYGGKYTDTADFRDNPRPFFSIGMIFCGKGTFYTEESETVTVSAGDIIIVPNGSTYISRWTGEPDISYITFHFNFEKEPNGKINIQKLSGMEYLKNDFKLAYDNFSVPEKSFKVLGIFYNVLDRIIPNIKKSPEKRMSTSVKKAVQYITVNYEKNITVSEISEIANLSPSRFFSVFKTETGTTPIEYKNRIAVRNAKKLLLYSELTIEEICEKLGFNSASYFRRTFKKFTGKSPREYRHDMMADLKL